MDKETLEALKTLDSSTVIDEFGGTSAVAELCIVSTGGVSQWRDDGIPAARLQYLYAVRPEIFEKLLTAQT